MTIENVKMYRHARERSPMHYLTLLTEWALLTSSTRGAYEFPPGSLFCLSRVRHWYLLVEPHFERSYVVTSTGASPPASDTGPSPVGSPPGFLHPGVCVESGIKRLWIPGRLRYLRIPPPSVLVPQEDPFFPLLFLE